MVLGMVFMDSIKVVPIPFANTMCIVGERIPSMIPLAREESF